MASAQIVAGVGDFAVFGNEFEAEAGIDIVAVADIPNAAGQGAFFKVLCGRAVVGNVACPVVAAVVARLADTGSQRGFVFVHVPNNRTDVAFVEEVVIVVGDAAADSVFGVVADTGFQFVALDFGHVDFDGNAVALQLIEVGLYGRAGIVAVLLERLLQVEDFI